MENITEGLVSLSRVNRIEWQNAFRNGRKDHPGTVGEPTIQNRNVIPTWLG